jgi:NAD(P)-dependent dehydrogenase (short-subunit alcohol dehydrogenase family)
LLQAGCAKVILTARKVEGLEPAVRDLNSIPGIQGKAEFIVGNVSTMNGVDALVEELGKRLKEYNGGKLNILVNNAGASWAGLFEEYDDWKTAKTFDVNVRGPFNLTRR